LLEVYGYPLKNNQYYLPRQNRRLKQPEAPPRSALPSKKVFAPDQYRKIKLKAMA
jgi:hypothetical protein